MSLATQKSIQSVPPRSTAPVDPTFAYLESNNGSTTTTTVYTPQEHCALTSLCIKVLVLKLPYIRVYNTWSFANFQMSTKFRDFF